MFLIINILSFRIEFPGSDQIEEAMTVYMGKPRRRMESILKWEYFYYDCLVLPRKNKVPRNFHLPDENIF